VKFSDPADELVFLSMPQFDMKRMESVEQWAKNEGLEPSKTVENELIRDTSKKEFLDWLKTSLGMCSIILI
jgi:HSP90 family molecular chaperone